MRVLIVPKSEFKPKAFAYLRRVEGGDRVCITDHGHPVADILPHHEDDEQALSELRGLVLKYDRPMDSADVAWEANT